MDAPSHQPNHKVNQMSNQTLEQKREQLRQALPQLQEQYGIDQMWLFGSYVRDEQTTASDLDVLVTFHEPPTVFQFVYIKDELSELLAIPVDLVMESGLKPHVRQRIMPELVAV